MMTSLQQTTAYSMVEIVYHHTHCYFQDTPSDKEEENFPTVPLDDDVWLEEPAQTGTYASTTSHNHMACALTPAHTVWISYTPLLKMHQHHIIR